MEDTLGVEIELVKAYFNFVLILVLMEDTLGEKACLKAAKAAFES